MSVATEVAARREAAPGEEPRALLSGLLAAFPVSELLEFFTEFRKRGRLDLVNWWGTAASCSVASGVVFDARCGHLRGAEAIATFAWWSEGSFSFLPTEAEPEAGTSFRVSEVLMDAVRIADELERRSALLPGPAEPLTLSGGAAAPLDDLDCGVADVFAFLSANPGATLADLEAGIALAPVKIRLSVASLVEAGLLGAVRPSGPAAPGAVDDWWRRVQARHPGGVRVLVVCPGFGSSDELGQAVSRLGGLLGVAASSFSYATAGPSFARFRPASGGILSLTFLPLVARSKHLLRTFVRSVDLALLYLDASGRADLASWEIAFPPSVRSVFLDRAAPLAIEIERHVRAAADDAG
jgi:hypothetical protein